MKMKTINENFLNKTIVFFIIFFTFVLLIGSYIISPSYFLKYSPDGMLRASTVEKINKLRFGSFIVGLFFLMILIYFISRKNKIKPFVSKHKEKIINFLIFLLVLLVFLCITEITLRLTISGETSSAGIGPESIKFNQKYVSLNSDKMRDREFTFEKPNGTIRIAVVGDSITFGSGVKDVNNVYSKLLENKLNNNSRTNFEVLNFGVPGYNSDDELEIVKDKVMKYHPDVIIIGYVLNDLENVDPKLQKETAINLEVPYIGFVLRNSIYTYYYFESRLNRAMENLGLKKNYVFLLNEYFASEKNKEINRGYYEQIKNIANKNKVKVALVYFPMIVDFKPYPLESSQIYVKEVAKENGFYFIDILEAYQDHKPQDLVVNKYDAHPNELGHQLAAEQIYEKLMEMGITNSTANTKSVKSTTRESH